MKYRYFTSHTIIGYNGGSFLPHRLRMNVSYSEAGKTRRLFAIFAYVCACTRRTNPRAGPRVGPSQVRSRKASTVAKEANEKVRFASRKGPRSVESCSDFHSDDHTILDMLHTFIFLSPLLGCGRCCLGLGRRFVCHH